MSNKKNHEFLLFMEFLKRDIAQEYDRIQNRVREDPGTAGDQAEENWSNLLKHWLPANYPLVTKGRIISYEGKVSPQVDILVLQPSYPIALRDKKLYFAGGVVAAFECKLTLRKKHIKKAIRSAAIIKDLISKRSGNPFDELHQPIIFGILAHSHEWQSPDITTLFKISKYLSEREPEKYNHPRYMIDVVCIADFATFALEKEIFIGPNMDQERLDAFGDDPVGGVNTLYAATPEFDTFSFGKGMVLAALIRVLTTRMAFEDPSLRSFADYLEQAAGRESVGVITKWSPSVFSEEVVQKLLENGTEEGAWSKWQYLL